MLAKALGETQGLGTSHKGRASLKNCSPSFLLEKKGKEIWLTSKAKQLLNWYRKI